MAQDFASDKNPQVIQSPDFQTGLFKRIATYNPALTKQVNKVIHHLVFELKGAAESPFIMGDISIHFEHKKNKNIFFINRLEIKNFD